MNENPNGFGTLFIGDGVKFSGNFNDGKLNDEKVVIYGLIGKSCTGRWINGVNEGELNCDFGEGIVGYVEYNNGFKLKAMDI